MTTKPNSGRRWFIALIILGLLALGAYYVLTQTNLLAQTGLLQSSRATTSTAVAQPATVAIQPATLVQSEASAAGNLQVVSERSVALAVAGVV